ncbi:ribonuclease HI family protein [Variovorax sp. Varisp85]|jgi:ribonuclease HI|uniref:ribonuclease HI family protein n=1 Tax=unclassified Variovorax TaxID=663243 RepID=UPI000270DCA0|nr:ribonuclease HI family protein [Variovorax sp. CF313]EJL73425.1 ribonuclease HI [Variovorax sp. CF313]
MSAGESSGPDSLLPWTVYCDGSAMPNPGRMGIGAVLTAPDGARHTLSQATHTTGCNNEAELLALTLALQELRARGATAVRAYSDNSILVEQLAASEAKPIVRMAALFDDARALLASFDDARVQWIPRHRNGEADALARAALGFAPKPPARHAKKKRR